MIIGVTLMQFDELYAFREITRLVLQPGAAHTRFHTDYHWLLAGVSGRGKLWVGGQGHEITMETAGAGVPDTLVFWSDASAAELEVLLVEFMPCRVAVERNHWSMRPEPVLNLPIRRTMRIHELRELAEKLYFTSKMTALTSVQRLHAHVLTQQMILWLAHDERSATETITTKEAAVQSTMSYMDTHYAKPIIREQLAEQAGLAASYYSVLFKKVTGYSPLQYLERLKIHRAAELLLESRETGENLEMICQRAGFQDPLYMSKRFRKQQHISPSGYRKSFVPCRVAVYDYPYTHHLLALGIVPQVARFSSWSAAVDKDIRSKVAEFPQTSSWDEERRLLLEHEPQLILTCASENVCNRLRSVAPVVYVPWLKLDWQEQLLKIADLFGERETAQRQIAFLKEEAAEIRVQAATAIPENTRISIFKIDHNYCYLYGNRDTGVIFYEFLGYEPHSSIREQIGHNRNFHSVEIGMEQMASFAGELNFVILMPSEAELQHWDRHRGAGLQAYLEQLQQVSKYPVHILDYREWLHYDLFNFRLQLQKIPRMFAEISCSFPKN